MTIGVSLVLIVTIGSLVYSGYQEVTYIMQNLNFQEITENIVMNATHLLISGINLENRGLYPLSIAVEGEFALDGNSLGSNTLGPLSIPPGGQRKIDFVLPLQISNALSDASLMEKILFNGTSSSIRFNITFGMQPFVTGTVSWGMNETMGAIMDGFNLTGNTPGPYNGTHARLPVIVKFTNKSPLPIEATLSAQVLSTPQQPTIGNYGSGSMIISANPGQQYEGLLNVDIANQSVGQGAYLLELSLTVQGFTYSWQASFLGGV